MTHPVSKYKRTRLHFVVVPAEVRDFTLSIRERPKRLFKQKTMAVRISLRKIHPLSLSVIDFSLAARAFFVRVVRPDGLGEKGDFLRIRTVPAAIVVFEEGSEFPLSLKEELERSRILRSLYTIGLRNQRVKQRVLNYSFEI
ncbi:hypothetical protein AVEN_179164-1 [Araneus ventricosus]|uniref:Uncharacterized protein n=1 Tax=Araneus ventricosus TaxID=182803 RepID=A0A4Y2HMV2_ARAVE|nr:hypothetical protein AVEN_179164-1 [Araneus ventricosus]